MLHDQQRSFLLWQIARLGSPSASPLGFHLSFSEIPVSGSLKTDQNPPLGVGRLISSCDICGAKTQPGRQMFLQPKQTEVSVLVRTEETPPPLPQTSDILFPGLVDVSHGIG